MIAWFKQHAPIRRKLSLAFGSMTGLVIAAGASAALLKDEGPLGLNTGQWAAIGCALAAAGLSVLYRALIANPYVETVVRMERLAAGDLASPVNYTAHRDCVGRMTRAMHSFKNDATERQRLEAETRTIHQEAEARLRDTESAYEAAGRMQSDIVSALAAALANLSDGDLTTRVDGAGGAEYHQLREDFNGAILNLMETMGHIVSNMRTIRNATGSIAGTSDDLALRTEQQAASLEETAAALDQITATVKRTASGAAEASRAVSTARDEAEHSAQVVRDAITAMGAIERSSSEITQIIGVIDEIAFQTNLLALNAGVEAARAGEAGRGFAVVATEVRALAQRSAEAAKEIKALISASGGHVDNGVTLVGQTGEALIRISTRVGEIDKIVAEIAASAHQQAAALNEVNSAVNRMDQVTQQNAAMVQESSQATHRLEEEAGDLAALLGRFRLGDEDVVVMPPRGEAPRLVASAGRPVFAVG